MKSLILAIALATTGAFAAADTTLVLKPTAAQVKGAHSVGNKECPVSHEAIGGEMGPGRTVIYKGQAVTLCCASCVKKFAKDPAKFLGAAQASVSPTTPAEHEMHEKK